MKWIGIIIAGIVALVMIVIAGVVIGYRMLRRRFRQQLTQQASEAPTFPAWAEERDYIYSEEIPADEVERLRGLGPLRPFSDFALGRIEHVFRRVERGKVRYLMQLTVCADPGPDAPAVGAMTVAVAEVARPGGGTSTDVKQPAGSSAEASVHAHGRWVTSYLGRPLTTASMATVESRLDDYLRAA